MNILDQVKHLWGDHKKLVIGTVVIIIILAAI